MLFHRRSARDRNCTECDNNDSYSSIRTGAAVAFVRLTAESAGAPPFWEQEELLK